METEKDIQNLIDINQNRQNEIIKQQQELNSQIHILEMQLSNLQKENEELQMKQWGIQIEKTLDSMPWYYDFLY